MTSVPPTGGEPEQRFTNAGTRGGMSSGYYYAAVAAKEANGADGGGAPSSGAGAAERDEWEADDLDPSLMRDPFAAAGSESADPFAAAASVATSGDALAEADPLSEWLVVDP